MSDFTQISVCSYQEGTDLEAARTMFADDSSLADRDIYHACCVGDVEAVRRFLREDALLVSQTGGHFKWEPLMYACYSRVNLPGHSTLDVARVLLDHGADPNAYYMWGNDEYRFTALTGVFGEGENGPARYPEHPECETFARLLLDAGASPHDSQALYNRMFTPGHLCINLLIEYGLGPQHKNDWMVHDEAGGLRAHGEQTLRYQLNWAIKSRHPERARVLIEAGADLATRENERSLFEAAMLGGEPELAEFLVSKGAERVELRDTSQFAAACMADDRAIAESIVNADPDIVARTQDALPEFVGLAAETGRYGSLELLASFGADLCRHGSPIHTAVWFGDLAMVKLLIKLGVDPNEKDATHNSTAAGWAEHHGDRGEILEYLNSLPKDKR